MRALLPLLIATVLTAADGFSPGTVWTDSRGTPIQAHGGGILAHEGTYYWYGEQKAGPTLAEGVCGARVDVLGVSCYSSTDLNSWDDRGVVLAPVAQDGHDLHPSRVVERPKVLYHAPSRSFVMWMHVDDRDYAMARVGVAVAASPTGPFRYLGSFRPGDRESRDMTVFRDDDGTAWLVYSSDGNQNLRAIRLSDDYRRVTGPSTVMIAGRQMEAPALVKHGGRYHLVASGCTGWLPNAARTAIADAITGPWTELGNPCQGPGSGTTFGAQGTFILPVPGRPDVAIFMADRWNPKDLGDSRYVWLPLEFRRDGSLRIEWRERWTMADLVRRPEGPTVNPAPSEVADGMVQATVSAEEGCTIHAVSDGRDPRTVPAVDGGRIPVAAGRELRCISRSADGVWSPVTSASWWQRLPPPPAPTIPLGKRAPVKADCGWGTIRTDRSIEGNPLRLDGREYAHGLGTHATSTMTYSLEPAWRRFVAVVGIDDETGPRGSIQARVLVDGVQVAITPILRGNAERSWNLSVAIPEGAREISLVTDDAGDGYGHDHADWAEAGFLP